VSIIFANAVDGGTTVLYLSSSAGFAGAILGGGTEECAVRRATTVGRGAKPPSEDHKEATL
jgi:hypothetical protein